MSYHSEIEGIMEMVDRGCRRLMRSGGGALPRDYRTPRAHKRANREALAYAMELARTGQYTGVEIAKMTGLLPPSVTRKAKLLGIEMPDGRTTRHKKAA